jgi:hypothetical protein
LQIEGQVEGQTFSQDFNPILGFDFDPLRARLSAPKVDPALDPTTSVDPLHPTASGTVSALDSIPSSISAGPLELPMTVVRNAALGGLAFAFLLALIGGVRRRAVGEPNEIARQYRSLLLDAVAATHPVERRAIGVKTIGELARLAERYERFIVHEEEEGVHTYSVEEDGVVYWYQAIAGDDRARGLDSDAPLTNLHPIREAESSHRDIRIGS